MDEEEDFGFKVSLRFWRTWYAIKSNQAKHDALETHVCDLKNWSNPCPKFQALIAEGARPTPEIFEALCGLDLPYDEKKYRLECLFRWLFNKDTVAQGDSCKLGENASLYAIWYIMRYYLTLELSQFLTVTPDLFRMALNERECDNPDYLKQLLAYKPDLVHDDSCFEFEANHRSDGLRCNPASVVALVQAGVPASQCVKFKNYQTNRFGEQWSYHAYDDHTLFRMVIFQVVYVYYYRWPESLVYALACGASLGKELDVMGFKFDSDCEVVKLVKELKEHEEAQNQPDRVSSISWQGQREHLLYFRLFDHGKLSDEFKIRVPDFLALNHQACVRSSDQFKRDLLPRMWMVLLCLSRPLTSKLRAELLPENPVIDAWGVQAEDHEDDSCMLPNEIACLVLEWLTNSSVNGKPVSMATMFTGTRQLLSDSRQCFLDSQVAHRV